MIGGLPDTYDPEAVATAIREAVAGRGAAAAPLRSTAAPADFPAPADASVLSLTFSGATYGSSPDPRVGGATVVRPGAVRNGWQRFRLPSGLRVPPLFYGPIIRFANASPATAGNPNTSPWDMDVLIYGALLTGIPHDLGRIPHRFMALPPWDNDGPVGQLVVSSGGAKFAEGAKLVLDLDFFPIFGRTPTDVEYATKHLFGWKGDGATVSDFGFATLYQATQPADYENPDFQRAYAAACVTTDKVFSGFLITTCWGLSAWEQENKGTNGAVGSFVQRYGSATLFNRTVANVNELPLVAAPLPGGKSVGAVFVDKDAPNTLTTLLASGARAMLKNGSVEWAVG